MGAYRNPKLYGINYSKIAEAGDKAASNIGAGLKSIQEQRKEAYDKLVQEYSDYNDQTRLERAKGLNEAQNQAIQESVRVPSLADFSKLPEEEKAKNLDRVQDVKAANEAISHIIEMSTDPNVTLYKGINPMAFELANDLRNRENIGFKANEDGLGYKLVQYKVGDDGERTGEVEEYDMTRLIDISTKFRDVRPVLNSLEDKLNTTATAIQKRKDDIIASGGAYSQEDWEESVLKLYNQWSAEEKAIYFSEYVEPHGEFAPTYDVTEEGIRNLSKEEREAIRLENETKLQRAIVETIGDQIRPSPAPPMSEEEKMRKQHEYRKAELKYRSYLKGTGDDEPKYNQQDFMALEQFYKDYDSFVNSQNSYYVNKYLAPSGFKVRNNNDGTFSLVTTEDIRGTENGEDVSKSIESEVRRIPWGDREAFFKLAKSKMSDEKALRFFNLLGDPRFEPDSGQGERFGFPVTQGQGFPSQDIGTPVQPQNQPTKSVNVDEWN